jgi:spoIIIJ-associated protein
MEGNEKEHSQAPSGGFEIERGELSGNHAPGEAVRENAQILEEYERKRRAGKREYAQSFLEDVLFRMGIEGNVTIREMGQDIQLEIEGDNGGLLIGKHGKTLDAIQYILNKIYQRRFGEGERVFVDTENYRKRRVEALESLALRLGEKVKNKRRPLVAGVFNSRDRRAIHMALKGDAALETESRGDGFYKKLVIRPVMEVKDEASEESPQLTDA